jgi:hypothetical protein
MKRLLVQSTKGAPKSALVNTFSWYEQQLLSVVSLKKEYQHR